MPLPICINNCMDIIHIFLIMFKQLGMNDIIQYISEWKLPIIFVQTSYVITGFQYLVFILHCHYGLNSKKYCKKHFIAIRQNKIMLLIPNWRIYSYKHYYNNTHTDIYLSSLFLF